MDDANPTSTATEFEDTAASGTEDPKRAKPKTSINDRLEKLSPLALIGIGAGATLAIGLLGVGVSQLVTAKSTPPAVKELEGVYKACQAPGIDLTDEGYTLIIESKGEGDLNGASTGDVACVLNLLETPSSVISHIDQTTSMDGRQTEQWDDYEMQWSYHPDRGLDGLIKVVGTK